MGRGDWQREQEYCVEERFDDYVEELDEEGSVLGLIIPKAWGSASKTSTYDGITIN